MSELSSDDLGMCPLGVRVRYPLIAPIRVEITELHN